MLDVPVADALSPEFFTDILRQAGHGQASVSSFSTEQIGTGQMAKCIRFWLDFSHKDDSLPKTLVGKFPSDSEASRMAAVAYQSYGKEVRFYQTLADRVQITTPRCYWSSISEDLSQFALILSDMAPAVQGDQLAGCSPAVLSCAMKELAALHAPTWNNRTLLESDSYLQVDETARQGLKTLYASLLPSFFKRFKLQLSSDQMAVFQQVAEATYPMFAGEMSFKAVLHGDYRLDNLLIDPSSDKPSLAVVDWQTYTAGNPLFDVAYVIATSLDVATRRQQEQSLVQTYHQALVHAGVQNFSFDDCWLAYRQGVFGGFLITVVASMSVMQTERGDTMFSLMARGLSQLALDTKATELLR